MDVERVDAVAALEQLLRPGGVRSVFQPIVDLDVGVVVGYEALARGPKGPLANPDAMFGAARAAGRLAELDAACRRAAFEGAAAQGLGAPMTVFVNVEPAVLDTAPLDDLLRIANSTPSGMSIVLEITERALVSRPAELLQTVIRIREFGWGVALDDVGADPASLAFMPLLRPDVIKLDLRLVQERPGPAVAEIMNAVLAHAERSGALVLAEGIEDGAQLEVARSLGATLGQGWLFGRPQPGPVTERPAGSLMRPAVAPASVTDLSASPFGCLPSGTPLRRSAKALLIEVSKQLEREAARLGETCVVAATFQHAEHFTPSTEARYRHLAQRTGFVCALGEDLVIEPAPGVRGAHLDPEDEVRGEWDLTVVGPHFSAALLARDLGDDGPDVERRFEYALTYDRDTVVRATAALLARVSARAEPANPATTAAPIAPASSASQDPMVSDQHAGGHDEPAPADPTNTLQRALEATRTGVSIANMLDPDHPLIYVNAAFEQLSGVPAAQSLGRNCRSLQGPDTDPAAISRIRAAVAAGRECRETVLNYRGPQRTPWWNDIHLAPITDDSGRVVQYIGVQQDVSDRINAETALRTEQERSRAYLRRIETLAYTDPLTNLKNRRRIEERVEAAIFDIELSGGALAMLFLDLDGFKSVNDQYGHDAGDELLRITAARLLRTLRRTDLVARLGGDEFLVVLTALDDLTGGAEARRVADKLAPALAAPMTLHGHHTSVNASIGIATYPTDGTDFGSLMHTADERMYAEKRARRATSSERSTPLAGT